MALNIERFVLAEETIEELKGRAIVAKKNLKALRGKSFEIPEQENQQLTNGEEKSEKESQPFVKS